jgi:hypothetical protein
MSSTSILMDWCNATTLKIVHFMSSWHQSTKRSATTSAGLPPCSLRRKVRLCQVMDDSEDFPSMQPQRPWTLDVQSTILSGEHYGWCIQTPPLQRHWLDVGDLAIMHKHPDSRERNHQGQVPLHKFCQQNPKVGDILFLLGDGISCRDNEGYTPIHSLMKADWTTQEVEKAIWIVEQSLKLDPSCLSRVTNSGDTVLHLARDMHLARWIHDCRPELCRTPKKKGDFPVLAVVVKNGGGSLVFWLGPTQVLLTIIMMTFCIYGRTTEAWKGHITGIVSWIGLVFASNKTYKTSARFMSPTLQNPQFPFFPFLQRHRKHFPLHKPAARHH